MLRPEYGLLGRTVEIVAVEFARDSPVVVAGHTLRLQLTDKMETLAGIGAIPDAVPRAKIRIDVLFFIGLKDRLEGFEIAVDIRKDPVAHAFPCDNPSRTAPLIGDIKIFQRPLRRRKRYFLIPDMPVIVFLNLTAELLDVFLGAFRQDLHPSVA